MPGPVQNPMTESKESTIAKAETWQCCGFTQASDAKSCIECGAPRKATGENKEDARTNTRKNFQKVRHWYAHVKSDVLMM